jgi:serine/threonine protein kinase/WD40 repeat protein
VRLGPYTLDQELGRGASGVVYQGRSPQGHAVAIKLLAAQSPEVLERFQREARLHEQLGEQAGFVPFHDMGLAGGRPYLVMPLLQGGTLRDRLQRGPLTVRGALELGERLASALGRAHALGIVHRDVKPENVLFDGQGHAFLADLGMAKHFRHDVTGASQSVVLSRAGEVRGTVSYMSPEQLTDAAGAGPAADVFALGALLYECLSGEPAFNADTYVELLVQIAGALHVPLRKRGQYPGWLTVLVEDCLAAEPAKRPGDGLALAARLSEGPRQSAERGRRVRLAATTLFGLSILGSGIAGAVLLQRQVRDTPSPPASPSASAPSPAPTAADTPAEGRFPASWRTLSRGKLLSLESAWRPVGVSRASQVAISPEEGVMVVGEESVFALGEGPPRPLVSGLPGLRRGTSFAALDSLLLLQEKTRFRVFKLSDGALRSEGETLAGGRLATYAFGGVSVVVAHGKRLATYKSLPQGKGQERPKFAKLLEVPRVLAANKKEVMAAQGTKVAFLNILGKVRAQKDYGSPVVALAYRRGESPRAMVGTEDGKLHLHEESLSAPKSVATGLAPLQALFAGHGLAALAGETGVALIDLETREVIDRLDMSALGTEVVGVALSQDEDALVVGTEDGQVLRYSLRRAGEAPTPTIPVRKAWGDLRGRHAGAVTQVVADERFLLSCDGTGVIQVWDARTGEALRSIKTSSRAPRFVVGPSGRAWVIDLGRLREWDLTTGHELRRLPIEHGAYELSLREDEQELAAVGFRGDITVWDLASASPRLERKFPIQGREPRRVTLLPDGGLLLGYTGGTIALRDRNGLEVWTRQAGEAEVHSFHPMGEEEVLVACVDGQISTWGLKGGRRGLNFKADPMTSLSLSGERLLLGLSPGRIEMRDAKSGEVVWNRVGGVGIQPRVALRSTNELFLGGADRLVRLLRVEKEPPLRDQWPERPPGEQFLGIGFNAETQLTTLAHRQARTFDTATGREAWSRPVGRARQARFGRAHFLTSGVVNLKGRRLTSGLHAWPLGPTGEPIEIASPPPPRFTLSEDGRVVAYPETRNRKSGVRVVNLETKAESFLQTGRSMSLYVSPRGRYLILTRGAALECWSVSDEKKLSSQRSAAALLTFLPTRPPLLLEAQLYGMVRILDPVGGRVIGTFTPRARRRPALVKADPSGTRVALSYSDGRLELWGVPQGKRLARFATQDQSDQPAALAFSPSGGQLAVLSGRGRVQVFSVPE